MRSHSPLPTAAEAAQPGDIGRFDTWVGYDVGQYPQTAAMGDFDGDGSLDVAWGMDSWSPGEVSISLNLGDGTLAPAVAYARGQRGRRPRPADLDGDGDLDLVAATQGDYINEENIDLFLNDGSGKFTRTSLKVGDDPYEPRAGRPRRRRRHRHRDGQLRRTARTSPQASAASAS